MSQYASTTTVSAEKSRAEIERLLQKYGATNFMYGWDDEKALVRFTMEERMVQFLLPMPDRNEFNVTPVAKQRRSPAQAHKAWEQATRQRWRALKLVIQAKLEAVEADITTFDEEFLAHIVLPDGSTVGEFMLPQVDQAYLTAVMPSALALGAGD